MTQKEYREKTEKYETQIADLQMKLHEEKSKNFNYLEVFFNYLKVLERNYQLQKDLDYERSKNEIACRNIDELNDIIDKYKKIIDKFIINF